MFDKNFYPTPQPVIDTMLHEADVQGKYVLEPQSGKGDILTALRNRGAKTIACELNDDLARIAQTKCDHFLKPNFLNVTADEISHVSYIVMNPPFDTADKHIEHAWAIAPDGCEIISLCNSSMLDQQNYTFRRSKVMRIATEHGKYRSIGNPFSGAERKTDVDVSLIHLFKPRSDSDEFEGYFDMNEELEQQGEGIMSYNAIREIVNRYVGAVKMFDGAMQKANEINELIEPLAGGKLTFGAFEKTNGRDMTSISRDTFKKQLQKNAWHSIFNHLDMDKYVTSSVMNDVNKFVEQQENVPFTVKNVYRMLFAIVSKQGDRMNRVIVEAFDRITAHHHDNRYHLEGWKTNDKWMVNRKFILDYEVNMGYGGHLVVAKTMYSGFSSPMDDLHKALCYVTGTAFNSADKFYIFCDNVKMKPNVWYHWGFFEVKGFKKGTLHAKFKSKDVWQQFNLMAAKAKGWQLPDNMEHEFRKKQTGVQVL